MRCRGQSAGSGGARRGSRTHLVMRVAMLRADKSQARVATENGTRDALGEARHKGIDEGPGALAPMDRRALMDDRTDASSLDHEPDEERDAGDRGDDGLDGEEVADLVEREPDGDQEEEREEEEAEKVLRVGAAARDAVGDVGRRRPDADEEDVDALSALPSDISYAHEVKIGRAHDPALHAGPDASHRCPVQGRPQTAPDTERVPDVGGEDEVELGAGMGVEDEEDGGDAV